MRTTLFLAMVALVAATARAGLPEAILDACLAPSVTEHATGRTWQACTRKAWETRPLRVHERDGLQIAEQDGAEHPSGWVKTTLTLTQKPQSAANPRPTQTFTVTATPTGVLPETTLTIALLKDAPLPPCTVRQWGDRLALVADAGDWYLIAGRPKDTFVQREDPAAPGKRRWTLTAENLRAKGQTPVRAAFLIGEGALPPPPAPAKAPETAPAKTP